jgi:hypothetical protein
MATRTEITKVLKFLASLPLDEYMAKDLAGEA